jgi:ABC-type transport system involved in cytochrome c biogenesis ATPase subunit
MRFGKTEKLRQMTGLVNSEAGEAEYRLVTPRRKLIQ